MFEGLRFFKTISLNNAIKRTKLNVLRRSEELDFELLGRSLSHIPFMPRMISKNHINLESKHYMLDSNAIIVDTIFAKDISLISHTRHYDDRIIIHKDIFISKYQVLESLVYGADYIILAPCILAVESLKELYLYANHLGLGVVTYVESRSDIAIANELGMFIFIANNRCLREFIPDNKIIVDLK